MAKMDALPLTELYDKKITASVEAAILSKEDFSKPCSSWCNKVCKLKNKNPPQAESLIPTGEVDVLIIQDTRALPEPRFKRSGQMVERTNLKVINQLAHSAFRKTDKYEALTYSVTSLLKCSVTEADITKNKAPSDTVLMKCRPYLLKEIELRKPKVLISLNTSVTKALGLKKTNYGNRGEIFQNTVLTLHPRTLLMLRQNSSGKFWGPDFYEIIQRDFHKAAALVRGRLRNPDLLAAIEREKKNIFIARSEEDVVSMATTLYSAAKEGKFLSYDLETTGLDPWAPDARIISMQFGFRNEEGEVTALVFPMFHRDNKWYDPNIVVSSLRPLLESAVAPKIGHNLKFDVLYTAVTLGIRLAGIAYDTMLLLHAKDSGTQGNLGLKQAVWDYLPDSELGGYEDLLPKLTTAKQLAKLEEDNPEEEEDGVIADE